MKKKHKICFVVAVKGTAEAFLADHIVALSRYYEVYLVANLLNDHDFTMPGLQGVKHVSIMRDISLINDVRAVIELAAYFRKMKFDAIHSVTPKAGFITALAGKIAGIKNRIHIFTGQVWATKSGLMRQLLMSLDKLIVTLNNYILVDGESQRQFLIKQGVVADNKSKVLGAGSICGANSERFAPIEGEKQRQRALWNISLDKVVYSFMGRQNKDKGIYELLQAFNELVEKRDNVYLILFGSDEENCMSKIGEYSNIIQNENFQFAGSITTPHVSLQVADVFCLPSYREGFGMSVVEASSLGLPVICSDAYGLADTMVDCVTGLRCKVADVESLRIAMEEMYDNPELRSFMGRNGRARVQKLFSGETIVKEWVEFYKSFLIV